MPHILVIDDDSSVRDILEDFLQLKGFEVSVTDDGEKGISLIQERRFDLFLVDLVLPGMNGMEVIKEVYSRQINIPAIIITGYGAIETAVEAIKLGAFDYITKPFVLEELFLVVQRALDFSKLKQENLFLKRQLKQRYDFHGLIGSSPGMQKVYGLIKKVCDTDATILIEGESGTGKELIAKTIHFNSLRAQHPFIPFNCAAIPKDLLESELFGHERGAFTGAFNTRIGRFERAHGGTILLDEIGELHPSFQVKLLRVLQEREFERVGGSKTIKVDVRILAATNKKLEEETKAGNFREDLFYRLNVIPLQIPPLRERREDIPLLAEYFLSYFSKKRKRENIRMVPEVMQLFSQYPWPGNVRELENLIERVIILSEDGLIEPKDLPQRFKEFQGSTGQGETGSPLLTTEPEREVVLPDQGVNMNTLVEEMEKSLIQQAIRKSKGVKSKAAELLGLKRTTLLEKMKKFEMDFN
ncbi:MAG: sigma-54-dependent Fis family transcriptional regulator [Deltaproteobacteria bacterium]|nr:sigma-54-dependent Fis family transcriptional regulator [Deltaproteobacteria bacterium]